MRRVTAAAVLCVMTFLLGDTAEAVRRRPAAPARTAVKRASRAALNPRGVRRARPVTQLPVASPVVAPTEEPMRDSDELFWEQPLPGAPPPPERPLGVPSAPASRASSPVRLSGLLIDGGHRGSPPDPWQCFRLTNTDRQRAVDLSGYSLSDSFGVAAGLGGAVASSVVFPTGLRIKPGEELWVASNAATFERRFGFLPAAELSGMRPSVLQLTGRPSWPVWGPLRGVVSLHDAAGETVDLVPYDRGPAGDTVDKREFPVNLWTGPSVLLFHASPFGWTGQLLARDRAADGNLLVETNSAADWDSGFSSSRLGFDPVHRVEYPGQSRFTFAPVTDRRMALVAASAPENAFSLVAGAIESARRELLVHAYSMDNDHLADRLLAARARGVAITLFLEGNPVGGIADQQRYVLQRLHESGIPVWFMASDVRRMVRNRYVFDHSKYLIADGETVVVGTENPVYDGLPVDASHGNRGWLVQVRSRALAAQLRQVWQHDLDPTRHADLVEWGAHPGDAWGLPYRTPGFRPQRVVRTGTYPVRRPLQKVTAPASVSLIACPDNCLSENDGLLGLFASARESLLVVQNSLPLWWGRKNTGSFETTPNLPLAAVVQAASRGVRVRLLLDGTDYNREPEDPRDNEDTVRYINALARRTGWPLEARLFNSASTGLEKLHAKGVVVDGRRVLVGSMNWTEVSCKVNREVALVVDSVPVAGYFASLFDRDWNASRLFRVELARPADLRAGPDMSAVVQERLAAGTVVEVLSERIPWVEVRRGDEGIGWVPAADIGTWLVLPHEAAALTGLGRPVRVEGRISRVRETESGWELGFGRRRKVVFVANVSSTVLAQLVDQGLSVAQLKGRVVELSGVVVEQKKMPTLVVTAAEKLRLVGD